MRIVNSKGSETNTATRKGPAHCSNRRYLGNVLKSSKSYLTQTTTAITRRRRKSTFCPYPGPPMSLTSWLQSPPLSDKRSLLSRIFPETSNSPSPTSSTCSTVPNSQTQNGRTFSLDGQLTSTMSYLDFPQFPKMPKRLNTSATLKSQSDPQLLLKRSRLLMATRSGLQPGIPQSKQQSTPSHIEIPSSRNTGSTSYSSLLPCQLNPIIESSVSIKPSESGLCNAATFYPPISTSSLTSKCTGFKTPMHRLLRGDLPNPNEVVSAPQTSENVKLVDNGMKGVVLTPMLHATTNTSVPNVDPIITPLRIVQKPEYNSMLRKPRYARDLVWAREECPRVVLALATESEQPVPSPPSNELNNTITLKTIHDNPHLFKIVTPINVDLFQSYLVDRPNQPFVLSVC